MMIRIGCCGFPVARAKYFQRFSAVEVQKTFYQPPRVSTADRWRREAPSGFVYTMKAWQLITHESSSPTYRRLKTVMPESKARHYGSFQPTEEVLQAWRATARIAEALRPRGLSGDALTVEAFCDAYAALLEEPSPAENRRQHGRDGQESDPETPPAGDQAQP